MHDGVERAEQGHGGATIFDSFDASTFLQSVNQVDGSFVERFIMPISDLELGGAVVDARWLDHASLYLVIDAIGEQVGPRTTFDNLDVTLWVDPGHNDGVVSAGLSGVGFSHGTSGDIALAHGSFVSAVFSQDPDLTRYAEFTETLTATRAGRALFGHSLDGVTITEHLTTPVGVRDALTVSDGSSVNLVNGGSAEVDLSSPAALQVTPHSLAHALRLQLADELGLWHPNHHAMPQDHLWA
jgi:hypothetical protein